MSYVNPPKKDSTPRVAGGFGKKAEVEPTYYKLRRIMGTYLMGTDRDKLYYKTADGKIENPAESIIELANKVNPKDVAELIKETRLEYGIRHASLLGIVALVKSGNEGKRIVKRELPTDILATPTDALDLVALWRTFGSERKRIPHAITDYIRKAFPNWDEYQLRKHKNANSVWKLADLIKLVRPIPKNEHYSELYKAIIEDRLPEVDTWESALSTNIQTPKREIWVDLMKRKKLPALATIRNIRNMLKAGVSASDIKSYVNNLNPRWLSPLDIYKAIITLTNEGFKDSWILDSLTKLAMRTSGRFLPGETWIVVDVSGSMGNDLLRGFIGRAFSSAWSVMVSAERYRLFFTAGNDSIRKHATIEKYMTPLEFVGRSKEILSEIRAEVSYGGIFTSQVTHYLKNNYGASPEKVDRLVIISDSQDCDYKPKPPEIVARFMYDNNIAPYKYVGYGDRPPFTEIAGFTNIVKMIAYNENLGWNSRINKN